MSQPPRPYVIWSIEHTAWWAPNRLGYSETLEGAGSYTAEEAAAIVAKANYPPGTFHECMIPIAALAGGDTWVSS